MLKVSHFSGQSELGPTVVPLHGPADSTFEKIASATLLDDVSRYINALTPDKNSQYVLVNAMGAGEFFGSNINGDHFPEAALIHSPKDWTGNPLIDKAKGRNWAYGYPTFYAAHPYAHHRNKDPSRAYGEVELACWHERMKRVELVVRVDHDKCQKFGGIGVWDKLKAGQFPDVSMGSKVPYDTCSVCLDWGLYHQALQTFDPKKHRHAGQAALQFHKKLKAKNGVGIPGLSITRRDYCDHAKLMMNRIFPDGRKVFVYNDFPRFFDISFVFIGADKTAKVMLFIFKDNQLHRVRPSAEIAEDMGVSEEGLKKSAGVAFDGSTKKASISDELLKRAFGKLAKNKKGEIDKQVIPSQFAGKAVPLLTKSEPDIPEDVLTLMGQMPLEKSLATTAGLGVVLKPREFQRITLIQLGKKSLADELDCRGEVFEKNDEVEPMNVGAEDFLPSLARLLLPLFILRSALGPLIEKRVVLAGNDSQEKTKKASSHSSGLLRKISSAYNGYRRTVIDLIAHAPTLLAEAGQASDEISKVANAEVEEMFTPLTYSYLTDAYSDEFGVTVGRVVEHRAVTGGLPAWRGASPQ